jgi:putative nucleotidyltransferase with HDIG domain
MMTQFDLAEAVRQIPTHATVLGRALAVLDDPQTDARTIAGALELDPSLCLRLLQLANSAYFGATGTVGDVERAVVVLGRSVVQPVVVLAAADVFGKRPDDMPDGFWHHCAAVAAGCSVAASLCSRPAGEAICVGLIHDLGTALMHRHDPAGCRDRRARFGEDPAGLLADEAAAYGVDHAELGARALEGWQLPSSMIDAIRSHHAGVKHARGLLGAILVAGEALAREASNDGWFVGEPVSDLREALVMLGRTSPSFDALIEQTAQRTSAFESLFA